MERKIYYMYYAPTWQGCFDPVKIIIHLLRDNSCDQRLDLVVEDGYGVGTTSIQGYIRLNTVLIQRWYKLATMLTPHYKWMVAQPCDKTAPTLSFL